METNKIVAKGFTLMRVFANGPGDRGSISRRVIIKIQEMVLDASLPSNQH